MFINYCDLCNTPLKDNNYYMLYSTTPDIYCPEPSNYESQTKYNEDYDNYLTRLKKDVKSVCPTCKLVYDKIFELRLQNLSCLSNELLAIYNLPQYNNKKKK